MKYLDRYRRLSNYLTVVHLLLVPCLAASPSLVGIPPALFLLWFRRWLKREMRFIQVAAAYDLKFLREWQVLYKLLRE